EAAAARSRAPAPRGREAGGGPARGRVADRRLAGRHGRRAGLALRGGAGPAGARRHGAGRAASRGVVPGGVAGRRGGAGEVLALDPVRDGPARGAGRDREAAVADRARLRGAEAGTRPGALRGPRLARLPPPRALVRRRVRLPGGRALPLFPPGLATPAARAAGRLPPPGLLPCARSGTARPRSPPCAGTWASRRCAGYRAAPAACELSSLSPQSSGYDTVVVGHRRVPDLEAERRGQSGGGRGRHGDDA